jgi:hypothetical protein
MTTKTTMTTKKACLGSFVILVSFRLRQGFGGPPWLQRRLVAIIVMIPWLLLVQTS